MITPRDDDKFYVVEFQDPVVAAHFGLQLQDYLAQAGMISKWASNKKPMEVLGLPPGVFVGRNVQPEFYLSANAVQAARSAQLDFDTAREIARKDIPANFSVLINF